MLAQMNGTMPVPAVVLATSMPVCDSVDADDPVTTLRQRERKPTIPAAQIAYAIYPRDLGYRSFQKSLTR